MDQQPASKALPPGEQPAGAVEAYSIGEQRRGGVKAALVNLIPPASVVAVVLFWWLAPQALVSNPWTIVATGVIIMAFIQLLEWFFERHEGWRLNKREFATDVFYVVLSYTVIAWATNALAEEPLQALKASLGLSTPWIAQLPFLVQVVTVFFLVEFGQYWMHRAMHDWHPLWLTHAPHHHITQLNALKGAVGNPIELFLISLSVVALFDFQLSALFCAINLGSVVSGFAHANVRSDPPQILFILPHHDPASQPASHSSEL